MRRRLVLSVSLTALSGLALTLGGCGHSSYDYADYDYHQKHAVTVEARTASLVLEPGADATQIPAADRARLHRFVADFLKRGTPALEVSVLAADESDATARVFARTLGQWLVDNGVRPSEIRLQLVTGAQAAAGTAAMQYTLHVAQLPQCGDFREPGDPGMPSANFGCATQRNFGLMVANPRDMIAPRDRVSADGERAGEAADRYSAGYAGAEDLNKEPTLQKGTSFSHGTGKSNAGGDGGAGR